MTAPAVSFLAWPNGQQFFTANGNVAIGANVSTFSAGSLTPCNTYTDVTGTTLNPNPIQVNTGGFLGTEIWTVTGTNTRIQVYDSAGNLLQDKDNIPGVPYVPGSTGTVYVIDSIYSTDTANAASANAVNWDYKIANAAYNYANTLANTISNVSANLANVSANSVNFDLNGVFVANGNTINWLSTSSINVAVVANGTSAVNVSFSSNNTTSSNTSNSHITINGITIQWAYYGHVEPGEAGPFTDDFPFSFPNACLGITLTTSGGPGAAGAVISSITRTAFTWYTQYGGADMTGLYVIATGY